MARALIHCDRRFILCKIKGAKWCFLPGGHVEAGEAPTVTVARELHEELGIQITANPQFLTVVENKFELANEEVHEFNFVFEVGMPAMPALASREEHIEFVSVSAEELGSVDLKPPALKEVLRQFFRDGSVIPYWEHPRI